MQTHTIPLGIFQFTINPVEPIILPAYKGSTLRGGFGFAFKRVVCAIRNKECMDCLLKEKCIYSYVFETPPPSDTKIMRKYKSVPHPFIISPPDEKKRGYKPGDTISFGLTLIGKAIDYLPYFIYAFDELGKIGIGKGKAKYTLQSVLCDGKMIFDSESKTIKPFKPTAIDIGIPTIRKWNKESLFNTKLTLNFLTPTRILFDGHLTLDLEFHIFIRNLMRRLSLLSYFHCNTEPSEWDFRGTIEKAKLVRVIKKNLRWHDWQRYSGRQETRLKMGGFLGDITFEGNIEPFLPLISAGEILHVGKGTAFGLGKYSII